MPRTRRPAVVLVVAILNLIFGGMGLLGALCGGPMLLIMANVNFPGPGGNPIKDMIDFVDQRFPYTAWLIVALLLGLVLNTILIVAGIGLIKMRPWARWLSIGYAIFQLFWIAVSLVVSIVWVNPILADWQKHFNEKAVGPNAPAPPSFGSGMNNVMSAAASVLGAAYAITILILLFLPSVRAAFARADRPEALDDRDDYEEEDDRPDMLDERIRP